MKEFLVARRLHFVFVTGFVGIHNNFGTFVNPSGFFAHMLECRVVHSTEFYVPNEVVDIPLEWFQEFVLWWGFRRLEVSGYLLSVAHVSIYIYIYIYVRE